MDSLSEYNLHKLDEDIPLVYLSGTEHYIVVLISEVN